MKMQTWVLAAILFLLHLSSVRSSKYEDEVKLREKIFQGYNPAIRPVAETSQGLVINFTCELLNIESMDTKSQILTLTIVTIMKWRDELIPWTESMYTDVGEIHVSRSERDEEQVVWQPRVFAFNTISEFVQLGNDDNPMVVHQNGDVMMQSGVVLNTHCEVDVTYYPFDTQSCDLRIGTFIYVSEEVRMHLHGISSKNFRENQEWTLLNISGDTFERIFDGANQSVLEINLILKRREPFFIIYLILPLVMLSFLNPVVFLLPSESGETVSLSITTLLTYAVFLTVITELVPSTSMHIPILVIFLFITFVLSCVTVWMSVIMIKLYNKPDEDRIPTCVQWLTCSCLAEFFGIRRECNKCASRGPRSGALLCSRGKNSTAKPVAPLADAEDAEAEKHADGDHGINWQIVVQVINHLNFWLFFLVALFLSITIIGVFIIRKEPLGHKTSSS